MRTKRFKKQFWFSEDELIAFRNKFQKSGLSSEAELIRQLILDYHPREKPDDRFYEVMKQMRAIGNNLNQIATKANSLGFIDVPYYKKESLKWNEFMIDVKKEFLNYRTSK